MGIERNCNNCDWDRVKCQESGDIPDGFRVIYIAGMKRTIAGKIVKCPILNSERSFARIIREVRKEIMK